MPPQNCSVNPAKSAVIIDLALSEVQYSVAKEQNAALNPRNWSVVCDQQCDNSCRQHKYAKQQRDIKVVMFRRLEIEALIDGDEPVGV